MITVINQKFVEICKQILQQELTIDEWAGKESDDEFQSQSFCGGYDADEGAFCFSYYASNEKEHWFQLTLDEVKEVVMGKKEEVAIRASD